MHWQDDSWSTVRRPRPAWPRAPVRTKKHPSGATTACIVSTKAPKVRQVRTLNVCHSSNFVCLRKVRSLVFFFFYLITQDYQGSTSTNLVQKAVVYSHARIHVAMIYPMDERKWREGKEWDSGLSLARFGSWWPEDLVWIAFASESRDILATYTKFACWLKFPRSEPWRSYTCLCWLSCLWLWDACEGEVGVGGQA